jgi:sugar phosphate isomerase/epimerase
MTFSTPELSLAENFEVAKRFGYDGIEPRLDQDHKHGIEVAARADEREAARVAADDAGVAIACLATSIRYADPAQTDAMLADTHARIDLAGDVGCPTIRVFGGKIPDGMSRKDAIALLARSLASVADHAAERNVTVCLETHDDWTDPAHVATVLRAVDHPHIAANWDIMHPIRTGKATIEESFETLKPWVRHLHIHDRDPETDKLCPIGEGDVDHRRVMELLKSIDYAGTLSGEWIGWEPWEMHLPREIETLRRYEGELD